MSNEHTVFLLFMHSRPFYRFFAQFAVLLLWKLEGCPVPVFFFSSDKFRWWLFGKQSLIRRLFMRRVLTLLKQFSLFCSI